MDIAELRSSICPAHKGPFSLRNHAYQKEMAVSLSHEPTQLRYSLRIFFSSSFCMFFLRAPHLALCFAL
ncbi:uncharacterized [Tachysurus ichikawai]